MGLLTPFKAFIWAIKNPDRAEKAMASEETAPKKLEAKAPESQEPQHLRLLGLLQQSSRLIDFLKEDISAFEDAQVGAAVRQIHEECGKCLEDLVTIRPLMEEKEGTKITVPQGYDPSKIKVVGKVKGEPPFIGTLIHKGWKAHKRSLPKQLGTTSQEVICPAEVEIKG